MASSCIVPVVKIENVRQHPNADRLELCNILGWQVVILKNQFKTGDTAIYFPMDTILSDKWIIEFGVKNYLIGKEQNRVSKIKLRGEPSFGLLIHPPKALLGENWCPDVGENVADIFDAVKYIPPINIQSGDAAPSNSLITRYTDIENLRNFPNIFQEDEIVLVHEKIHGTNCKIGYILNDQGEYQKIAASMGVNRVYPGDDKVKSNLYWYPWSISEVHYLMDELKEQGYKQILLYGEIFGKVQNLKYDKPNDIGFLAFDLLIDGQYLIHSDFIYLCDKYDIETVPFLYKGLYSLEKIKELSEGKTTLNANHIREGIVVRPLTERTDPKIGRVILKYISDSFLLGDYSNYTDN